MDKDVSIINGIAAEYSEGSGVNEAELGMSEQVWTDLVNAELRRRYPLVPFVPAWLAGQAMTLSPRSRRVDNDIDYEDVVVTDPAMLGGSADEGQRH